MDFDEIFRICAPLAEVCALPSALVSTEMIIKTQKIHTRNIEIKSNDVKQHLKIIN